MKANKNKKKPTSILRLLHLSITSSFFLVSLGAKRIMQQILLSKQLYLQMVFA